MAIDAAAFRKTLSHFASGVTIVTTRANESDYGLTVSAFSSLSLVPPLVLICIEKTVKTHDAIRTAGNYVVNLLGEAQQELSNRFASRIEDKFAGLEIRRSGSGIAILPATIGSIECAVRSELDGGDHTIFVGEIENAETFDGAPLVYFRGSYRTLA
jgi:flavin reductase (DIM6/NTAB) family NADH-FMN oxidoreductase RutF